MVKLGIFMVVFNEWSCDISFCSIFTADFYENIFSSKKNTLKPKIVKLIFFGIFLKWRHSDRKWLIVTPCITKWPYYHFCPHFRQNTNSGGILNNKWQNNSFQNGRFLVFLFNFWMKWNDIGRIYVFIYSVNISGL